MTQASNYLPRIKLLMQQVVENNLVLLSLVNFVIKFNQRIVLKILQKVPSVRGPFLLCLTGGLCTSNGSCYKSSIFTCVALAKAGLVVGPLRPYGRPSVCPSVRLSVRPSVCPSVRPQHFRGTKFV